MLALSVTEESQPSEQELRLQDAMEFIAVDTSK